MRLEVRTVDHQLLRDANFGSQGRGDALEDAHPAPANEAVVERLVRAVAAWRILPHQPVADDVDDPADHPPVINPRNSVLQRKIRFDPAHLPLGEQKQIGHRGVSKKRQ